MGQRHTGKYYIIEAEGVLVAREKMHSMFGPRWCLCYNSAEEAGVEMYGLSLAEYDEDHERASGELNDLLRGCTTMSLSERDMIESFSNYSKLSKRQITTIGAIYERRM